MIGKRCKVTDSFLINVRKRTMTKKGTVIGAIKNPYWHRFLYKAYKIKFDDGTENTYKASDVVFL